MSHVILVAHKWRRTLLLSAKKASLAFHNKIEADPYARKVPESISFLILIDSGTFGFIALRNMALHRHTWRMDKNSYTDPVDLTSDCWEFYSQSARHS